MEKIRSLFFGALFLSGFIFSESKPNCETREHHQICVTLNKLTSVSKILPADEFYLQSIMIMNDNITSIAPNAFDDLILDYLLIRGKEGPLEVVPDSFTGLKRLKMLVIESGAIQLTPDIFKEISKTLKSLSLSVIGNSETLKYAFSNLELEDLSVSDSNLQFIDVTTLKNITTKIGALNFHRCGISFIEGKSFESLKNLTTMNLDNNNLTKLEPDTFYGLDNLTSLSISSNEITVLPKDAFKGLNNLTKLYLEKNKIDEINVNAFNGTKITDLYLNENNLTALHPRIFDSIGKTVKWIWMHNNQISVIKNGAFSGLNNLTWLDLRHNKLKTIEAGSFDGLNTHVLDISYNDIDDVKTNAFKDCKMHTLFIPDEISDVSKNATWRQNVGVPESTGVYWDDDKD